jgi:hypothetical protein
VQLLLSLFPGCFFPKKYTEGTTQDVVQLFVFVFVFAFVFVFVFGGGLKNKQLKSYSSYDGL